jgi:alpha-tubulin suppressor-like RCC1 family protein
VSQKGVSLPCYLDELSFTKIVKVRAGSFSACLNAEGSIFVWGEGVFGAFHSPHRIKSSKELVVQDIRLSNEGQALLLT